MRQPFRAPLLLALLLAPLAVSLAPSEAQAAARDDVANSKEAVKIAEEQALLHKQLKRLRRTMETLLDNLEAEGRPRATELLRDGLTLLDQRLTERDSLTLDEIMNQSRTRLEHGQMVQALDRKSVV